MVERRRPSSGGLCHCALTCCHATSQDILWELGECGVGRGVSLGGGVVWEDSSHWEGVGRGLGWAHCVRPQE